MSSNPKKPEHPVVIEMQTLLGKLEEDTRTDFGWVDLDVLADEPIPKELTICLDGHYTIDALEIIIGAMRQLEMNR